MQTEIAAFITRAHGTFNRVVHHRSDRYECLMERVAAIRPERIVEIGTWNGAHGREMILTALRQRPRVEYYGFDMFEDITPQFLQPDKVPPSMAEVRARLAETERLGATVRLYKGNSREVLPRVRDELPKADLVFIDGGHDYDTVCSDWQNAQTFMHPRSVAIFDDYVDARSARLGNYGVNRLVDEIDSARWEVTHLVPSDWWPSAWGILTTHLVEVRRRI